MRWRAIAAVSLIVNSVLAVAVLVFAGRGTSKKSDATIYTGSNQPARTNVVVRRQFFSWKEVESPDYPTYIANLRDIGCPEQSIQEISQRSQDRMQAYLDQQRAAGLDPDPVEVARLRQQTRVELQGVLSPPALEEFLLRYSQNANDLRSEFGQLRFFNATPDEF